jgi:hypothetical protein
VAGICGRLLGALMTGPTSLKRGEGLLVELTCDGDGDSGGGSGEVVAEEGE